MENGSKALIMAASVFLGILLFSAMIYLFRAGARMNEQYEEQQVSNDLVLYNSKFELYNEPDNSILDIISVANLAYNINKDTDYDDGNAITIDINVGNTTFQISGSKKLEKRNTIFIGKNGNYISIYDLVEKSFNDLGISMVGSNDDDKLSMTKYDSGKNETIYKYLFASDSDKIEYHSVSNKIIHMEFNCYINENFIK